MSTTLYPLGLDRPARCSVHGALSVLGLDEGVGSGTSGKRARKKRLWARCECDLLELLHAARSSYRQAVRAHHPDHGGDPARLASAVDAWRRVRRAFQRRGYALE